MEIIKQLAALGNTGAHTEGYVDRAKGKFAYRKVDGPITVDMIAAHLDGTQPLGMYLNVDEAQQKSPSPVPSPTPLN